MTFPLTEEQQNLREAVREFASETIAPQAREHDQERRHPTEIIERAAEQGFVAPNIPAKYGGAELDTLSCAIIAEDLWRGDPGIGDAICSRSSNVLIEYGDEKIKEQWLPKIATGESAIASSITEPDHGSDVANLETTATRVGDSWVIDGEKTWITNATVADVAVVVARTSEGEGHRGLSIFLVPTALDGVASTKIDQKLGLNASDLGTIRFEDVEIPAENLIGEEDEGFYQLMDIFGIGRALVAANVVGLAQASIDAAISYAETREQFDQPISEFQAIRHKVAESATAVEASRSLTYRAATELDADKNQRTAARLASMAKLFASEKAVQVADEAVQVHGSAGITQRHPVERYYRDARVMKLYEGTSEIQKNIIADGLL